MLSSKTSGVLAAQLVMPMAREFAPDLVIVSAGFDAAEGDPLGGMCVSPAGVHPSQLHKPLLAPGCLFDQSLARACKPVESWLTVLKLCQQHSQSFQ